MFDGSVHRKTLALSDNLLSGDLPAWALQRSAVDPALVVLLQVRARACCSARRTSRKSVSLRGASLFIGGIDCAQRIAAHCPSCGVHGWPTSRNEESR